MPVALFRGLHNDAAAVQIDADPIVGASQRHLRALSHFDARAVREFDNRARFCGGPNRFSRLERIARRHGIHGQIGDPIELAIDRSRYGVNLHDRQ